MLEIFPEHVLDNSLHTAILVGLVVTWGMYELLGWVFAGFVVAGYLTALGVVSPTTLGVVLVESLLCYGIVWFLGTGMAHLKAWSRVFGRERFLLFVLVAIPVRLVVTGLAMPNLEAHLLQLGWSPEDMGLGLFGIGVVLVPLTANTFWKLGVTRGLFQLTVNTGATWLFVTQVLMRFTNFGFGSFEQTFDALAVHSWASSRAVLVLLCAVFLAARNNLRYGWDFGGILVPALLAMMIFTPWKIATTLVEIVLLYVLYEAVIRLPRIRELDLEGPRRIVSIYALSYGWKVVLAVVAGWAGLPFPVSDVFGFGYLLTALVVARCHKAGSLLRTLVPLSWTAAQGVALAFPLGLVLTLLPRPADSAPDDGFGLPATLEAAVPALAARAVSDATARREAVASWATPTVPTLDTILQQGGSGRGAWLPRGDGSCIVDRTPVRDPSPERPWVIACGGEGPVLVLPYPHGDPDAAWLAGIALAQTDASGAVIASVDPSRHPTRGSLAPGVARRVLVAAQRIAGDRPLLWVTSQPQGGGAVHPRDGRATHRWSGALDGVPWSLNTGPVPPQIAALWQDLRPIDAVWILGPGWVSGQYDGGAGPRGPLAEVPSWRATGPALHEQLLADVVLPAWRREAGRSSHVPPSPAAVHLADLVGADAWAAVGTDDGLHWVMVRGGDKEADRDIWIFRPGGGDATLMAPRAWRWPGLADVAVFQHEALAAGRTWISQRAPASTLRHPGLDDERSDLDRLARSWIRPTHLQRSPAPLVVLEPAQGPLDRVTWSDGNETLREAREEELQATARQALAAWPGAVAAEDSPATTWQTGAAQATTYQQALVPDALLIAWFPTAALRETHHADEFAARQAWWAAQEVPTHDATAPGALGPLAALGEPLAQPDVWLDLSALAQRPTEDGVAAWSIRHPGWTLSVWQTPVRSVLVARQGPRTCTAVFGAVDPAPAPPWSGCWEGR